MYLPLPDPIILRTFLIQRIAVSVTVHIFRPHVYLGGPLIVTLLCTAPRHDVSGGGEGGWRLANSGEVDDIMRDVRESYSRSVARKYDSTTSGKFTHIHCSITAVSYISNICSKTHVKQLHQINQLQIKKKKLRVSV